MTRLFFQNNFSYSIFYLCMQKQGTASTHEKQLEKIQSKIQQMEKANLEPKTWTMQGEVIQWALIFLFYLTLLLGAFMGPLG